MNTRQLTLTTLLALSLGACQTLGIGSSPEDALFAGIAADKIAPIVSSETVSAEGASADGLDANGLSVVAPSPELSLAESAIRASTLNPTCAQFNMNTLLYAAKPNTPGFGTGLMKTLLLGTVAGAASGGIASLGIGSAFLETAVAGTANQLVFNGARPVVDAVIPSGGVVASEKAEALKQASERVGCPYPQWVEGLDAKEAALLLGKLTSEAKAASDLARTAKDIVK
jgi:hypothetical protein